MALSSMVSTDPNDPDGRRKEKVNIHTPSYYHQNLSKIIPPVLAVGLIFILFIRYSHLVRILSDIRNDGILNKLPTSTRNLQNQVIERGSTKDVDVIGFPDRQ